MLGYCLTSLDEQAMWSLSAVLQVHLISRERVFVAAAVLWSLTDDEYRKLIQYMESEA